MGRKVIGMDNFLLGSLISYSVNGVVRISLQKGYAKKQIGKYKHFCSNNMNLKETKVYPTQKTTKTLVAHPFIL